MSGPRIENVRVAIVGAGPAGIGAALGLADRGIGPVVLLDRAAQPGGVPAKYHASPGGVPTYVLYTRGRIVHGQEFADILLAKLEKSTVQLLLETTAIELHTDRRALTIVDPLQGKHEIVADAIILATGAREETAAERGWIVGDRRGRIFHTMSILEVLNRHPSRGLHHPLVVGSDLVGQAVTAKLAHAGAEHVFLTDNVKWQRTPWWQRAYFARWGRPEWVSTRSLEVHSSESGGCNVLRKDRQPELHDALVLAGNLVPNSELLVASGLMETANPPQPAQRSARLSTPGWFVTGNLLGGFHGGEWCYFHGRRVARLVAKYLQRSAAAISKI